MLVLQITVHLRHYTTHIHPHIQNTYTQTLYITHPHTSTNTPTTHRHTTLTYKDCVKIAMYNNPQRQMCEGMYRTAGLEVATSTLLSWLTWGRWWIDRLRVGLGLAAQSLRSPWTTPLNLARGIGHRCMKLPGPYSRHSLLWQKLTSQRVGGKQEAC